MRTPRPGEMSAAADALRREKPKTAAWIVYYIQADFIYMGVLKSLSHYGGKWYNEKNLKPYVIHDKDMRMSNFAFFKTRWGDLAGLGSLLKRCSLK